MLNPLERGEPNFTPNFAMLFPKYVLLIPFNLKSYAINGVIDPLVNGKM